MNKTLITDAMLEKALARRAPGHADSAMLRSIVDAAEMIPQRRASWLPFGVPSRVPRRPLLAAAAVVAIAGAMLLNGAGGPTPRPSGSPSSSVGTPPPTDAVVASASPRPCATATTSVLIGDAMPPTATLPMAIPAGVVGRGAYTTGPDGVMSPTDVWFIDAGVGRRIATVSGPDFNVAKVTDVSGDGRFVLLQVGEGHGGVVGPTCDDLYLLRSDGSSVRRLTMNQSDQQDVAGRISPDGQWFASPHAEFSADAAMFTFIDLLGGTSSGVQLCSDTGQVDTSQPTSVAFSPDSARLAVLCGPTLEVITMRRSVTSFNVPDAGEVLIGFAWRSPTSIVLLTAENGATANAPILIRTLDLSDRLSASYGTWSAPSTVTPTLGELLGRMVVAPDRHAVLVPLLVPPDPNAGGWYVIDLATAKATLVSGQVAPGDESGGWSADSKKVVSMDWFMSADHQVLITDLATGQRDRYGTVPVDLRQAILVGPW